MQKELISIKEISGSRPFRLLDAKRLLRKMGKLETEELKEIKIKIGKIV